VQHPGSCSLDLDVKGGVAPCNTTFFYSWSSNLIELTESCQRVSAVGHQRRVLPDLNIIVSHQQLNLFAQMGRSPDDFALRLSARSALSARRKTMTRRALSQPESLGVSSTTLEPWSLGVVCSSPPVRIDGSAAF